MISGTRSDPRAPASEPTLRDLRRCFDGRIPAVIATTDAGGTPNVTYLSAVHPVDEHRLALSNQFFSKTSANLAQVPEASLLVLDPQSYREFRLTIHYERTERRGPVFDRLRAEVDRVAALSGMEDVFRLRSADIYRVVAIEPVSPGGTPTSSGVRRGSLGLEPVAVLATRLGRCPDLDSLVDTCLAGLDELLGHRHSALLLLDETGQHLYTIGSRGFADQGIASEVAVGTGVAGAAALRCEPVSVGHLRQLQRYASTVRRSFEADGRTDLAPVIPVPTLPDVQSQLAAPAVARGELVGVLLVESHVPAAFDDEGEAALVTIAGVVAALVGRDQPDHDRSARAPAPLPVPTDAPSASVRFFDTDGSVFVDNEYLIRGVAGRILWSLLGQYVEDGRIDHTTKELRLDPSLQLPEFRDNLDTRLILLKRRLDERGMPIRLERTGRGRVRLYVERPLVLERRDRDRPGPT